MAERWLPVPGYEGHYEVSDLGRVRSLKPGRFNRHRGKEVILTGCLYDGYRSVGLINKDGIRSGRIGIHTLVLKAFVGPPPEGHEGAHANGVRDDNRLDNLTWKTRQENQRDRVIHGTHSMGSRHRDAKLIEEDIPRIFDLHRCGASPRQIANWFGMSARAIRQVLERQTWQHVAVSA